MKRTNRLILSVLPLMLCALPAVAQVTFSNIGVGASTPTSVTIQWTSSAVASSQVLYGLGNVSTATPLNGTLVTAHSVTISKLQPGQVYSYEVRSQNLAGQVTTSGTQTFSLCSGVPNTQLTGTINTAYEYGLYTLTWVNDSGLSVSPTICGATFTSPVTGVLDSNGNLAVSLPDVNQIVPSPGHWTVAITSMAGTGGAIGSFSINSSVTGPKLDISAALQAAAAGQLQHVYYDPATQAFNPPLSGVGMVYPPAGVPLSTGTAWGTSYAVGTGANDLVQLTSGGLLPSGLLASPGCIGCTTPGIGDFTTGGYEQFGKIFYVDGFPSAATLSFGDGCLLQDGTSCSGTFYSQLDVANATAADWIYQHGNACSGGSLTFNQAACNQGSASLILGANTYLVYHPVGGPSNVPFVVAIWSEPSLGIYGQGKNKSIIRAAATMEAAVYWNQAVNQPLLKPEFESFSVDGGYHGVDSLAMPATAVSVSGTTATITGTFNTCTNPNALNGLIADYAGFANAGNNVSGLPYIITACTGTTLQITNAGAVAESGATATATLEQAAWAIELNGTSNGWIEHVDTVAGGGVGVIKLGSSAAEDAALFLDDDFFFGVHPAPYSSFAQGTVTTVSDGGGNYHAGSLTLNSGGNFYCSIANVNCTVQVRFVGAGTKQSGCVLPTATASAVNRIVTSLTLSTPGSLCGPNLAVSIEPASTESYVFYGYSWVNSTARNVQTSGTTSLSTPGAGFYFNTGGNHLEHLHALSTDVGYYDGNGGDSYSHPECDTITDECFYVAGDGVTITAMSSYWQAGTSYTPQAYDFYAAPGATNLAILSKVCRVGGQSQGGYYEFVDASGPDDALGNAPAGLTALNNEYCAPTTFTPGATVTASTTIPVSGTSTTDLRVGYPISAPSGVNANTLIQTVTFTGSYISSITVSQNVTLSSSEVVTQNGPLPRSTLSNTLINGQLEIGENDTCISRTGKGNIAIGNCNTTGSGVFSGHLGLTDLVFANSGFTSTIGPLTFTANRSINVPDTNGVFGVLTASATSGNLICSLGGYLMGDCSIAATSLAPIASPTFTGIPTGPTASASTSTTQLATTAFVATSFAPLAAPSFTGAVVDSGTIDFTSTTTSSTPIFLIQPSSGCGSPVWSSSQVLIALCEPTGWAGQPFNYKYNGLSTIYFSSTGNGTFTGLLTGNGIVSNAGISASQFTNTVTTVTASATPALVATNGLQTITLNASATPTITGITAGQRVTFQICQPASGGPYTWAWPAAIHGGMTIGTTASTCSEQSFDSYTGTTLVPESTGVINVAP
jgi:hypothetical protein